MKIIIPRIRNHEPQFLAKDIVTSESGAELFMNALRFVNSHGVNVSMECNDSPICKILQPLLDKQEVKE